MATKVAIAIEWEGPRKSVLNKRKNLGSLSYILNNIYFLSFGENQKIRVSTTVYNATEKYEFVLSSCAY